MPGQELEHFGIKGMKWGVRRTPAQLGHRKEKKLNRYKEKEIQKVEKRIANEKETETQRRKAYRNSSRELKMRIVGVRMSFSLTPCERKCIQLSGRTMKI